MVVMVVLVLMLLVLVLLMILAFLVLFVIPVLLLCRSFLRMSMQRKLSKRVEGKTLDCVTLSVGGTTYDAFARGGGTTSAFVGSANLTRCPVVFPVAIASS